MNRDLSIIAFCLVTWGIGEGMFFFFQPLYLQELGANPVEIGSILGLVSTAMIVAHLPAGYLADRFGSRPLLIVSWLIGGLSAWIMALATTLPVFIAGSAVYALTSFVISPLNSYITSVRGKMSVGRVISLVSAIYNAGAIAGPLLGGWIGNTYGLHTNYKIAASIFILSIAAIFFIRSQPRGEQAISQVDSTEGKLAIPKINPVYVRFLALIFLATFCMYLPQPLTANFLQNIRKVSLVQIGWLLSVRSLGIVVFNLVIGRIEPRRAYLISQAFVAVFSTLIWLGIGIPWYLMGYFMMGSYMTARTMASALGRELVPASRITLAFAGIETVSALAIMLAAPLAGFLYDFNPTAVYPLSIGLVLAALLCTSVLLPRTNLEGLKS